MDPTPFEKRFVKMEKIAEGSYGVVYRGVDQLTEQPVAIKLFKNLLRQGIPSSYIRELAILQQLQLLQDTPQYFLKLIASDCQREPGIVVQWIGGGSLKKYIHHVSLIKAGKTLKETQESSQTYLSYAPQFLMSQLTEALYILHSNYLLHRDLKPENVLLDEHSIKLIDYGMTKEQNAHMTNEVGTLHYRAPELLLGTHRYDASIDMWALGCIYYELLTGQKLFERETELKMLSHIISVLQSQITEEIASIYPQVKDIAVESGAELFWTKVNQQIKEQEYALLKRMVQFDARLRISAKQLRSFLV